MRTYQGIAASCGHAIGSVHRIQQRSIIPARRTIKASEVETESERYRVAVTRAKAEIRALITKLAQELGPEEAKILSSQLLILEDEMVWDATLKLISEEKLNAEAAFAQSVGAVVLQFHDIKEEVFRERIHDLRDIEERVLRAFRDEEEYTVAGPTEPLIVAASNLTPSVTASFDLKNVLAFVMDEGGSTSHVAILARSIGIPAVVGLGGIVSDLKQGEVVAVNGNEGELITAPNKPTCDLFGQLSQRQIKVSRKLQYLKDLEAKTPDGRSVSMLANIGLPIEIDAALACGAEGIGLLRTEYLYFQHGDIPSEDEQVKIYSAFVRRFTGKMVIFRTLDVGGDKVSDYLGAKREYNPFLGWRGIRFALANRTLFKRQVRAIYRAAVGGNVKIMFPLISGVEEMRAARDLCLECRFELERDGLEFEPEVELGLMMETPSATLIADVLARECDFFSIGTNDLIQYTLAMDRGNRRVSYLYKPLHPAILRSIRMIVDAAHAAGIPVGLCGEMGSETRLAEVLLGLGFDELSLNGAALPKIKQVIRWTKYSEARDLVDILLKLDTAAEADAYVTAYVEARKLAREEGGNP